MLLTLESIDFVSLTDSSVDSRGLKFLSDETRKLNYFDDEDFKNLATPSVITALRRTKQLRPTIRKLFPKLAYEEEKLKLHHKFSGLTGQLIRFSNKEQPPIQAGRIQEFFIRLFEETFRAGVSEDKDELGTDIQEGKSLEPEPIDDDLLEDILPKIPDFEGEGDPLELSEESPQWEKEETELSEEIEEIEYLDDYDYDFPTLYYERVWGVFICSVSEIFVVHTDQFNNIDNLEFNGKYEYFEYYHNQYYPEHQINEVFVLGFKERGFSEHTSFTYQQWLNTNYTRLSEAARLSIFNPRGY